MQNKLKLKNTQGTVVRKLVEEGDRSIEKLTRELGIHYNTLSNKFTGISAIKPYEAKMVHAYIDYDPTTDFLRDFYSVHSREEAKDELPGKKRMLTLDEEIAIRRLAISRREKHNALASALDIYPAVVSRILLGDICIKTDQAKTVYEYYDRHETIEFLVSIYTSPPVVDPWAAPYSEAEDRVLTAFRRQGPAGRGQIIEEMDALAGRYTERE